jgi:ABC-type multidrug transport system fused ATPase/permease subunit
MTSIRMRRTLCATLYDKVTTLSIESLAKTSSGKLIAMISSDLFALERTLTFAAMVLVFPVANLFAHVLIGFYFGWVPAAIVLTCFLLTFLI